MDRPSIRKLGTIDCDMVETTPVVFCGVNVSLSNLPSWMSTTAQWMPLTHGIEAARKLADGASLSLARFVKRGDPRLRVHATNLLNRRRLWPAGYSYLFFTRDASGGEQLSGTSYYYPQATRSVHATLDLRF